MATEEKTSQEKDLAITNEMMARLAHLYTASEDNIPAIIGDMTQKSEITFERFTTDPEEVKRMNERLLTGGC